MLKTLLFFIFISIIFSACDGSHDSSFQSNDVSYNQFVVKEGDSISPKTDDTIILVSHYHDGQKIVRVMQGEVIFTPSQ